MEECEKEIEKINETMRQIEYISEQIDAGMPLDEVLKLPMPEDYRARLKEIIEDNKEK